MTANADIRSDVWWLVVVGPVIYTEYKLGGTEGLGGAAPPRWERKERGPLLHGNAKDPHFHSPSRLHDCTSVQNDTARFPSSKVFFVFT